MTEARKDIRFEEIGRVEAPEICSLPGVLEDISISGCRVRFPVPVELTTEDEDRGFELKIYPSRQGADEIELLCTPCWVKNENDESAEASLGFKILHSPGSQQLEHYIKELKTESIQDESVFKIEEPEYSFI